MNYPVLLLSSPSFLAGRKKEANGGVVQVKCYNSVRGHYGWCATTKEEEEEENVTAGGLLHLLPHDRNWGWCTKSCSAQLSQQ